VGLLGVLGLIFIVLKLAGVIAWSWWLVLSPYLVWLAIAFVIYFVIGVLFATVGGGKR
jgi:hypothetical protein